MSGSPQLRPAIAALLADQQIGLARMSVDGVLVSVSSGFAHLVGATSDELIGRPLAEDLAPGGIDLATAFTGLDGLAGPLPRRLAGADGPVPVDVIASAESDGTIELLCRPHRRNAVASVDGRHQDALDRLPIGVLELQLGADTIQANQTVTSMIGTEVADLTELRDHIVDNERLDALVAEVFLDVAQGGSATAELELRRVDGHVFPTRIRVQMVAARDDDQGFLVITIEDLTHDIARDREHDRMLRIVEATTDLVGVCDLHDGVFLYMNTSARELLGFPEGSEVPAPQIFTARTQTTLEEDILPALRRGEPWRGDIDVQTLEGPRILDCSVIRTREHGDPVVAFLGRDVTEIRASAAEFARLANHDELTGLHNRAGLLTTLDALTERGEHYAVLYLDLDRFKPVNDTHGHQAGDEMLVAVGRRLRSLVRAQDCVARIGGDEFVVAAPEIDAATARELAERIRRALRQPIGTSAGTHHISTSVGAAVSTFGDEPESVLRDADAALYRAKDHGRDRVEIFSAAMRRERTAETDLADDLRHALTDRGLGVAYQPIVDIATGEVLAVEALARWHHPTRGSVPPDEFIALAERQRFIAQVDEAVWRQAIEDIGPLTNMAGRPLAIHANLSPLHLQRHTDLVRTVQTLIDETGLDPGRLCLEITESSLVEEIDRIRSILQELSSQGIELAIDDFGTGYSTLASVAHLDLDILKIDRCFVSELTTTDHGRTIASCIIDLARGLSLGVIAEGVECEDEARLLVEMGCGRAQGYAFHRPMPIAELRALIAPSITTG